MKKISKGKIMVVSTIAGGVLVNVIFGYLAYILDVPLYLDVIGTVGVAYFAGSLPALIVAVTTNLICEVFNKMSVYYTLVGMYIAIVSARYTHINNFKSKTNIAKFILSIGLIGGILGSIIQLLLLGRPQFGSVADASSHLTSVFSTNYYFNFFILNSGLNVVDKGIAVAIVLVVIHFIPKKYIQYLRNIGWKQTPLSKEDIKKYSHTSERNGRLQKRFTRLLVGAAVATSIIMILISMNIYYEHTRKEYTANAEGAVRMAATVIDIKRLEEFEKRGESAIGYVETEHHLYAVRNNFPGIKYLYLFDFKEDGCHIIFDLDAPGVPGYEPGQVIPYEDALIPFKDDLIAGKEIAPVESNANFGWITSVFYPLKDDAGDTVCYVGADVSMHVLADFIKEYLVRIALIFTGYLAVILAVGLWVSKYYLVYPINAMVGCTNNFMYETDNQQVLKDNVKKIKSLNIETEDELENLYMALCKMTEDTVEQMNDIRYQSKTINQMQTGLINTMADMVENRDSDTGYHILKTADYVKIIVDGLRRKGYYLDKLSPKFVSDVQMSAPLHDIGKINIPDAVLNKPGRLTDEEYEIMKTHTTAGKKIMEKAINTVQGESYLKEARNMAAYHHEKWDGSGYPEGLKEQVIPLSARIMAVADVFDALTSKRVYKDAMSLERAMDIIQKDAGTHFDPLCVEVFVESSEEVRRVLRKYQEI